MDLIRIKFLYCHVACALVDKYTFKSVKDKRQKKTCKLYTIFEFTPTTRSFTPKKKCILNILNFYRCKASAGVNGVKYECLFLVFCLLRVHLNVYQISRRHEIDLRFNRNDF